MEVRSKFLLESIFRYDVDQFTPVQPSFIQIPVYDKEGNVSYVIKEQDTASVIESHGSAFDWSLESLIKAGVDIPTNIRTSSLNRFEVEESLQTASSDVDSIFSHVTNSSGDN